MVNAILLLAVWIHLNAMLVYADSDDVILLCYHISMW